jgi:hypothetical protein
MVTWPPYWPVPVPFLTAWYSKSSAPVVASVITCSSEGVPSCCSPPTTVSQASTGFPEPAHTTLRTDSAVGASAPSAAARPTATASADSALLAAMVDATVMVEVELLVTPLTVPFGAVWTTRSPPRTGRPANVRS